MFRVERLLGEHTGVIFKPVLGRHSATVILTHGLGDSADGLSDLGEYFIKKNPYIKFILPTAKERPITMNMGYSMNAWYDIKSLDSRANDNCDGLQESSEYIKHLVKEEIQNGLASNRIVLAGFSQGGALSLYTAFHMEENDTEEVHPVGGVLVMSGYLPRQHAFKLNKSLIQTPVLHVHGHDDPLVTVKYAELTKQYLEQEGVNYYELKTYKGVGHNISPQMLEDANQFISATLPDSEEFRVKPKSPSSMSVKELKEAIREFGLADRARGLAEKEELVNLVKQYYLEHGLL